MRRMSKASHKEQFHLIQALRGFAALWVVLFHIDKGQYITGFTERLGAPLQWALFGYGSAGVAIFFVLSGFVISHSLAGKAFGGRDFVRFVARRSIRLDPPYWVAITLSIAVSAAIARVHHHSITLPPVSALFAYLLYLQEFVGAPEINIVFWTLTYEIQFYLVLALAKWLQTWLISKACYPSQIARAIVMAPMVTLALLAAGNMMGWAPHGLFVTMWHGFFLGVLAYEAGYQRKSPALLMIVAAVALIGTLGKEGVFGAPAAFAALGLFVAGRKGYLIRAFSARGFQLLGMISYSLYLIHVPVIRAGFAVWGRFAGRGTLQDSLGLLVILTGTLVASTLFWWLFERPSHKVAVEFFRGRSAAFSA